MDRSTHWQQVYEKKAPHEVSWFRPRLETSLRLIGELGLPREARVLDVGGGASTLVDDLLAEGFGNLAVLDLSDRALQAARLRLGDRASRVEWIVGDATRVSLPPRSVDLWHDRAVFHFLTEQAERDAYLAQVARSVRPGGHVLLATFAPDGPDTCSGLPVARYDARALCTLLGAFADPVTHTRELHVTPWGSEQPFTYCLLRVRDGSV